MRWLSIVVVFLVSSCIVHDPRVTSVDPAGVREFEVESPVKAHMKDGSTVVFPNGIWTKDREIFGHGERFDLSLEHSTQVSSILLDDVAAMETFDDRVSRGKTAAASGATTVGGVVVGVALLKAVFGSCPTTYSSIDGQEILEAESFSYSVVPGLEVRDVDRLRATAVREQVELEVRNEALETHYINHIELLEVNHAAHQTVFPDQDGRLIVFDSIVAADSAVDLSGNDLLKEIAAPDGDTWSTSDERMDRLSRDDMTDFVDLEFEVPAGDMALLLRFRNSLLNTVLFYDVMLKGLGFEALDWMGSGFPSLEMIRAAGWYADRMGMRISVWERGRYREVAHIRDQGPIAWKELAIPIPTRPGERARVRLSFIADNWHFDWIAASSMRYADARSIAVSRVTDTRPRDDGIAIEQLADVDGDYLVTRPGEKIGIQFDVGEQQGEGARTFFLAAEGYYLEWMRSAWLEPPSVQARSSLSSDESLWRAMQLWRESRASLRHQFESSRIAVK